MTIRRALLILPCRRLDDFPTHLTGERASELLAAWTALWHPALIAATGRLPGWHAADEPPDPAGFDGELVLVPGVSRQCLAGDWCDRLAATSPRNPPPVHAVASRRDTITAALTAAAIDPDCVPAAVVGDFLALGYAHLQVELLTRAMHYSSVLDTDRFRTATVAAATAAVAGNYKLAGEELSRAFDLLTDARNHVYSVDIYFVDVTLLAESTLGDALRAKLATGSPTSVLATGELLDQLARQQPASWQELRRAIDAATACPIGGTYHGAVPMRQSPERLLDELERGQQAARRHLERDFEVFAQFSVAFSPLLPEVLKQMGFRGALHATFDGGRLPKADQCKTWWGSGSRSSIEALAKAPLDVAASETWLRLAERIADSIAHDHVATVLLAGWPGAHSEYFDDLCRAARFGPVLGKLVTLEEYFQLTREPDEWTSFHPREYPVRLGPKFGRNPISTQVDDYCRDVLAVYNRTAAGLAASAGLISTDSADADPACSLAIRPWNFAGPQFVCADPLDISNNGPSSGNQQTLLLADVPGCGYATFAAAEKAPFVALAEDRTIRNERLELTVNETTGGIQSLRSHRDRSTRLSQRLVFRDGSNVAETRMIAERIEITRNDALIGQITSHGRLVDADGDILARFTQTVRLARRLTAAIVDVQLEPERLPEGDAWNSYFASRLAWADDAIAFRRGVQWSAQLAARERIESPEWIEIGDGVGTVTCFGLGLPYHRQASATWLDTLLVVEGEERRRFQFALGIDEKHPTHTALALVTAGRPYTMHLPAAPTSPTGWFLDIGAKNVLMTHIEPLAAPRAGIRLRLLETEGRDTRTRLTAFRALTAARTTDFRGNSTGVLSVTDGRVEIDIGPHRWIQVEAEW